MTYLIILIATSLKSIKSITYRPSFILTSNCFRFHIYYFWILVRVRRGIKLIIILLFFMSIPIDMMPVFPLIPLFTLTYWIYFFHFDSFGFLFFVLEEIVVIWEETIIIVINKLNLASFRHEKVIIIFIIVIWYENGTLVTIASYIYIMAINW